MTYYESVRFLYSLGNEVKAAKLGLDRVRILLEALDAPHRSCRFIHVAGTNGKGSTCAMIESALRASGLRTGLYTSPHLIEPTERICIAGEPVPRQAFAAACGRVREAVERLLADGGLDLHPTYFECVTAIGFLLFRQAGVDRVVLEVGLGGRLDATNVVRPELAVVTPIDFDHEAFLGRSIESIAGEKAGILKPGVPAVFAPQREEAARVLAGRAAALGIETHQVPDALPQDASIGPFSSRFTAAGREIECPLAGLHQVTNALTAIAALQRLGVPGSALAEGIRTVRWPARLERVRREPDIVLDGAHNPAGARALAAYIQRFHAGRRVILIFGCMRDKAVAEVAGILGPAAASVILTAARQPRAIRPESLREFFDHPGVSVAASVDEALASAIARAAPRDIVFVTGSLFLAGEARQILVK